MEDKVEYLQTLEAVRERCNMVLEMGEQGGLRNFTLDMSKLPDAAEMILQLIERDYGVVDDDDSVKRTLKIIPPHGRWRHFGDENVKKLIEELKGIWDGDMQQVTKSVLDLFVVAVLLDAGAGDSWEFHDDGKIFTRSEGLAVATFCMFRAGHFSSSSERRLQVDSKALKNLTKENIMAGFQANDDSNPLLGIQGRLELLKRLGNVLEQQGSFFPKDSNGYSRPGALLDYLLQNRSTLHSVNIDVLWKLVIHGFGGVWPEARSKLNGIALGDVWRCEILQDHLLPFHKLSQWLTYSLMEPITKLMEINFENVEKMTGLAEYRNGGLFVDLGIITLKDDVRNVGIEMAQRVADKEDFLVPLFPPDSQVIIEWRALTVALIDRLAIIVRDRLHTDCHDFPLAKLLEAGTWKAGRVIAKRLRPTTGGPPIAIISDGTLF